MQQFEWEVEIGIESYTQLLLVVRLYRMLFKPKGYKELVNHSLKLKKQRIYYQQGQSTIWIIGIADFSHFQRELTGKNKTSYEVFVHTKDGDMYTMECSLVDSEFSEMERVVSEIWCNV